MMKVSGNGTLGNEITLVFMSSILAAVKVHVDPAERLGSCTSFTPLPGFLAMMLPLGSSDVSLGKTRNI